MNVPRLVVAGAVMIIGTGCGNGRDASDLTVPSHTPSSNSAARASSRSTSASWRSAAAATWRRTPTARRSSSARSTDVRMRGEGAQGAHLISRKFPPDRRETA